MHLSQRCVYAIKALLDLAQAPAGQAVKIAAIAQRQNVPAKFLEAILGQLKGGGFVESRRGAEGGYLLARPAHGLTLGEVIRFVEGPLHPVKDADGDPVLAPIWRAAEQALSDVYDGVTFRELAERCQQPPLDFVI